MNDLMNFLYLPVTSALFAVVWVYALTEPGAIFGWWPDLSNKISTSNWWIKLSYGCSKCMAGQICIWRIIFDQNIKILTDFDNVIIWQTLTAILISLLIEKHFND